MLWIDLLRPSLSTLYATWQGCLPRTKATLPSARRLQQAFAELAHRIVKPATPALADGASKVCIPMICLFQPASERTVHIASPQQTWSAKKPRVEQIPQSLKSRSGIPRSPAPPLQTLLARYIPEAPVSSYSLVPRLSCPSPADTSKPAESQTPLVCLQSPTQDP